MQIAATTNTRAPSTVRVSGRADRGNIPRRWDPFPVPVPTGGITFETEFELADTSPVTAIVGLQGNAYIFTQTAIHQMTPDLGDAFITTDTRGALNADAVIEANGTLYCVGSDDIYTFSGHPSSVQSISDTRVREEFYRRLHPNFLENVFLVHNTEFNEVWVCYPTTTSIDGFCDEALIFNYINNTWTRKDMDNVVYGVTGPSTGGGVAGHTLTLSGRSLDQGQAAQQEIHTYTVGGTAPTALVAEQQTQQIGGTAASTFTQEVYTLGVDDDIVPTNRAQSNHTFSGVTEAASRPISDSGSGGDTNLADITGFNLEQVNVDRTGLGGSRAGAGDIEDDGITLGTVVVTPDTRTATAVNSAAGEGTKTQTGTDGTTARTVVVGREAGQTPAVGDTFVFNQGATVNYEPDRGPGNPPNRDTWFEGVVMRGTDVIGAVRLPTLAELQAATVLATGSVFTSRVNIAALPRGIYARYSDSQASGAEFYEVFEADGTSLVGIDLAFIGGSLIPSAANVGSFSTLPNFFNSSFTGTATLGRAGSSSLEDSFAITSQTAGITGWSNTAATINAATGVVAFPAQTKTLFDYSFTRALLASQAVLSRFQVVVMVKTARLMIKLQLFPV